MTPLLDPSYFIFSLTDTLYFFSGLLILLLGMAVNFRERGTSIGRAYLLFSICIATWLSTTGMLMAAQGAELATWLLLLSNLPVTFIPAAIFHYTRILLDQHQQQKRLIRTLWSISSVFALLDIFSLDFATAHHFEFGYYALYGLSGYLFLLYFTLSISWTYYSFFHQSLRMTHNPESRKRFYWLTIALLFSLFAISDFIPVLGIEMQPFGVIFIQILFVITTYVTWKYRLVDISSEYIANNLLHIIHSPLLIIDLYGNIKLQNQIAQQHFKDQHIKLLLAFLTPLLQDEKTTKALEVGQVTREFTIELDDYTHTFEITISPVYSRQNTLLAYTCLLTDITVLILYQDSLEQARKDLEIRVEERTRELHEEIEEHKKTVADLEISKQLATEASQAKSIFLSRMSHELRTPMNAIMGFSQLMQIEAENITPTEQLVYINHIHEAGTHLTALINDILDLSRIELDRLKLQPETVNIHSTLVECIAFVQLMANSRNIGVEIDKPTDPTLTMFTDKTRLKQVVINLLNNAIKYNKDHGSVIIQVHSMDKHIRISIRDSGIGIPADTAEKIFIPFERLSNVLHDSDGAGIGLSLSKHLVELQGGSIGYESEEGIGSTFWFELPFLQLTAVQ